MNQIALFLIGLYQRFSFSRFSSCRFEPSCSCYAQKAFKKYNFFSAFGLVIWRVLRCHPFSRGGFDPVK